MFVINDVNGQSVPMNEIFEEGFNITASNFKSKNIGRVKRDVFGEYLLKTKNDGGKVNGGEIIPTGIDSLDSILGGGFKPGLYVIGANPGTGKTSLLLHILTNLAINKKHSLFFSLDMSDIQTVIRIVANTSYRFPELDSKNINDLSNSKTIINDDGLDDEVRKIYQTYLTTIDPYINVMSIHENSLGKIDRSVTYVESVEIAIKNFKKYYKTSPVVVIDYLQLLQNKPSSNYRDDNDGEITLKSYDKRIEMDKIVDELKTLSSVYGTPIIVITSTNRSSYTKSNFYESNEYDIGFSKESGNIEYTADVLIRLTSSEGTTNFGGPNQEIINLHIAKSRFGKQHVTIPLNFIPEYAFFSEVTKD